VFDRLAALAHGLRIFVETLLHSLQHVLVLPTCCWSRRKLRHF
jgi:hypothetical protein